MGRNRLVTTDIRSPLYCSQGVAAGTRDLITHSCICTMRQHRGPLTTRPVGRTRGLARMVMLTPLPIISRHNGTLDSTCPGRGHWHHIHTRCFILARGSRDYRSPRLDQILHPLDCGHGLPRLRQCPGLPCMCPGWGHLVRFLLGDSLARGTWAVRSSIGAI